MAEKTGTPAKISNPQTSSAVLSTGSSSSNPLQLAFNSSATGISLIGSSVSSGVGSPSFAASNGTGGGKVYTKKKYDELDSENLEKCSSALQEKIKSKFIKDFESFKRMIVDSSKNTLAVEFLQQKTNLKPNVIIGALQLERLNHRKCKMSDLNEMQIGRIYDTLFNDKKASDEAVGDYQLLGYI